MVHDKTIRSPPVIIVIKLGLNGGKEKKTKHKTNKMRLSLWNFINNSEYDLSVGLLGAIQLWLCFAAGN